MEDSIKLSLCGKYMNISPDGNKAIWESMSADQWEQDSLELIADQLSEEDVFIDIGAWAGPITLFATHYAAYVYAIEPDPFIYTQLKRNVNLNPDMVDKIHCSPIAISDKSEFKKLFARNAYGQSSSSLLSRILDQQSTLECESLTFSEYIYQNKIKHVDFIKMDIEGSEFFVLPQMLSTLEKLNFPSLLVSFHMDYLVEYYLKKWGVPTFLSRVILKVHRKWKLYPFKRFLKLHSTSLKPLIDYYSYCYTPSGLQVDFQKLYNDPFRIGKNTYFFSKQAWSRHA